jgi:hypothetical protein
LLAVEGNGQGDVDGGTAPTQIIFGQEALPLGLFWGFAVGSTGVVALRRKLRAMWETDGAR